MEARPAQPGPCADCEVCKRAGEGEVVFGAMFNFMCLDCDHQGCPRSHFRCTSSCTHRPYIELLREKLGRPGA